MPHPETTVPLIPPRIKYITPKSCVLIDRVIFLLPFFVVLPLLASLCGSSQAGATSPRNLQNHLVHQFPYHRAIQLRKQQRRGHCVGGAAPGIVLRRVQGERLTILSNQSASSGRPCWRSLQPDARDTRTTLIPPLYLVQTNGRLGRRAF